MSETRNYDVIDAGAGAVVKSWTRGVPVEPEAAEQLMKTARMPFVHKWIAAMPDVHVGIGSTVGSVIPTKAAIIPAAVGVDIGCGMMAMQTYLKASDLPDSLGAMRSNIEAAVPHGRGSFTQLGPVHSTAWGDLFWNRLDVILEKHPMVQERNAAQQLGTLGGGNHFIEVCLDERDCVWVMLHSGSRGIGNRIGTYFIELAKKEMRRWHINLPDQDLAYLPEGSTYFDDYVTAVHWAQEYALKNRELMMGQVLKAVSATGVRPFAAPVQAVNCHHNYVAIESHYGESVYVTRKGAVRAREGDMGIIPGSMGARSFIVRGKGNPESFHSCSHGAGRIMSRTEAKKRFTLEDHAAATIGVECRRDADVIDETPGAYKDIASVMAAQSDLVDVVHTLRQVLCVKG